MSQRKIVIGIGGSSGSIYAKILLDKLKSFQNLTVGVVMSENAKENWRIELGEFNIKDYPFKFYEKNNFYAPFASGSAQYDTMIICPSSMGLVGRIANGVSTDLMTRAADVVLKERRRLIIVPREMPWSLIHLRNLTTITEAGGIVCPAIPSFYSNPSDIHALCETVVDRILDLAQLDHPSYRWGE